MRITFLAAAVLLAVQTPPPPAQQQAAVIAKYCAGCHNEKLKTAKTSSLPPEFIETLRSGWWTTCLENLPAKERRRGRF